ncbi:MAG: hypothetical protein LBS88_11020 [Tannerellaceae bacterium]|jgi:hypothetical protein|nr:hypothetical protein [Tannerellaceae bacterium]
MMRIISALIVTILLFAIPLHGQRGDWYNDEGGFAFQGSGTKDDPYQISSVTAFAFLAEQVNMWPGKSFQGEYFILTEDIDLGKHYWIPIGSESHQPFRGVFDGKGKSICNLYIGNTDVDNVYAAAGLFGYLGNGAKIENLTIDGGLIIGGGREATSRTGSLAGYALCSVSEGEDSIIIRNCHNKHVKITGANTEVAYTGGLIGEGYAFSDGDGSALLLMENCSNSAVVAGYHTNFPYTGGIIGKGHGHGYCDGATSSGGSFILRSCINKGDITGGAATGKDAITSTGGILGFGYGSGDSYGNSNGSGLFTIEYCLNTGTISGGDAAGSQAFSYTGGIFGYGDGYGFGDKLSKNTPGNGYGSGTFIIQSSANKGTVKGGNISDPTAVSATGGLAGFASGSASGEGAGEGYGYGSFSMRNCYSYAQITTKKGFIGGLTGWLATIGNGTNHTISAIIQNSYVAGSINQGDTVFPVITGGIAGRIQKSKEANKTPQIGNCLVALSYLNGGIGRTFRIAGQIQGILQPFTGVFNRNYAYIKEGEWVNRKVVKNGYDWNHSMLNIPVSSWNVTEKAWIIVEDGQEIMPALNNVPEQGDLPVPSTPQR